MDAQAALDINKNQHVLYCKGDWTLKGIEAIQDFIARIDSKQKITTIDGSHLKTLDSAGAYIIQELLNKWSSKKIKIELAGFSKEQQILLELVGKEYQKIKTPPQLTHINWLGFIGELAVIKVQQALDFLAFFGRICASILNSIVHPIQIKFKTTLRVIETAGYQALPIIALMSFLIGMVLAYQMGIQLRDYGANIYIVDFSGLAILREFAPLITSIIIAGRSATSFTAQIGTMRVNQEIDALETMGDSPFERLVLPKVFALIIVLPLLTVWADIFGILGSMLVSKQMMHIGYGAFLDRFKHYVKMYQFVLGVIKAPVFAIIIAMIGCFQGFQVKADAESVGSKTTKAAVQSIFLIIIADAAFSILFSWLDL